MPNMDGMEAKKKLELLEETKNIPIIALSAVLSEEDIISPFDGFLKKPVSKEKLIEEISKFLNFKILEKNPHKVSSLLKETKLEDNKRKNEIKLELEQLAHFEKDREELRNLRTKISIALKSMDIESIEKLIDYFKEKKDTPSFIPLNDWFDQIDKVFQSFDMNNLSVKLKEGLESIDQKIKIQEKKSIKG